MSQSRGNLWLQCHFQGLTFQKRVQTYALSVQHRKLNVPLVVLRLVVWCFKSKPKFNIYHGVNLSLLTFSLSLSLSLSLSMCASLLYYVFVRMHAYNLVTHSRRKTRRYFHQQEICTMLSAIPHSLNVVFWHPTLSHRVPWWHVLVLTCNP